MPVVMKTFWICHSGPHLPGSKWHQTSSACANCIPMKCFLSGHHLFFTGSNSSCHAWWMKPSHYYNYLTLKNLMIQWNMYTHAVLAPQVRIWCWDLWKVMEDHQGMLWAPSCCCECPLHSTCSFSSPMWQAARLLALSYIPSSLSAKSLLKSLKASVSTVDRE